MVAPQETNTGTLAAKETFRQYLKELQQELEAKGLFEPTHVWRRKLL
jgi:hypothetical protein